MPHGVYSVSVTGAPRQDPLLALNRTAVDRASWRRSEASLQEGLLDDPRTAVLDVLGDRVPMRARDGAESYGDATLVLRAPRPSDRDLVTVYLGEDDDGRHYVAVLHDESGERAEQLVDLPAQGVLLDLRAAGGILDDAGAGLATTAIAMAHWHRTHRHCPRCGARTEVVQAGWVRRCPVDGAESYPLTHPAVIMAVTDPDDRLLLARGAQWAAGRMSVLAGFVEPGESLESAVAREVREEVGVRVRDVRYVANQPWPFPASLMLAFAARADDPRLVLDPGEIAEARWFSRADFAAAIDQGELAAPSGVSVARHLIEGWFGGPVESRTW